MQVETNVARGVILQIRTSQSGDHAASEELVLGLSVMSDGQYGEISDVLPVKSFNSWPIKRHRFQIAGQHFGGDFSESLCVVHR